MTKTFPEVISGIRTAKKGVEVREDIAQMGEYVEQFAQTATEKAAAAAASEEKASAAVKNIDQQTEDAVTAITTAESKALTDVETARSGALTDIGTARAGALEDIETARTGAVQSVTDTKDAALTELEGKRASALQEMQASVDAAAGSAEKAAASESNAGKSEEAAASSASAAATSETNSAASEAAAKASADSAAASAKLAGTRAGTDKTLSIEDAPADAKAVGDALNSIDLSWDAVQNKPEVFPPESHTHDDRYYKKAEIDQKVNYLAAMNENATKLVFSGSATVNASSGGSFSVPSTVNYIDFGSYKNIVRGGTAKGSQSYYFGGGGGAWQTGSFTITFSQSGTVSWTKLSTSSNSYISNDSSTYNVKGYHYITMADFAATQAALQSAQSDTDALAVDLEYRITLLELGVTE